jgi:hypothetical protein
MLPLAALTLIQIASYFGIREADSNLPPPFQGAPTHVKDVTHILARLLHTLNPCISDGPIHYQYSSSLGSHKLITRFNLTIYMNFK